ncbi:hypothetical protein B7463_g6626, partial [Scytalidium lignicola]
MASLDLSIVIYTPVFGNYLHWALSIFDQTSATWHIFQVIQVDEDHPFEYHYGQATTSPANSDRFIHLVHVADLDLSDWETIVQATREVPFEDQPVHWNCQDWAYDVLDILLRDGLIDDYTRRSARVEADRFYGPDVGGGDDYGEQDEEGNIEEVPGKFLSEEYVYDSDEGI